MNKEVDNFIINRIEQNRKIVEDRIKERGHWKEYKKGEKDLRKLLKSLR